MTTDVKIGDKLFIMELHLPGEHQDEPTGYMTLTETCDAEVPCKLVPENVGWRCTTHKIWQSVSMLDEEGNCENFGICDDHETYDFRGIE